jgi:ribosomal protein L15E
MRPYLKLRNPALIVKARIKRMKRGRTDTELTSLFKYRNLVAANSFYVVLQKME